MILIIAMCFSSLMLLSQTVPQVQIKSIDGKTVNTAELIKNDGKPVLLCFFTTTCKPCIKELTAYNDLYADWSEETGVKIVIVSNDNARSVNNVKPFVDARGWDFDVYLDPNGDFKKAMNVSYHPHSFLLDGSGKVVWQHTAYLDGDEEKTFEVIKKVATGQPLK